MKGMTKLEISLFSIHNNNLLWQELTIKCWKPLGKSFGDKGHLHCQHVTVYFFYNNNNNNNNNNVF